MLAIPANVPLTVVDFLEGWERQPKFLDRIEATNSEKIFLEDAGKTLGNVTLRLPDVRSRLLNAQ